jgi:hypothetical protein
MSAPPNKDERTPELTARSLLALQIFLYSLFAVLLFLVLDAAEAAGTLAREARPIADFNRVVLRGVGNLYLTQGKQEALSVEAEKAILPKIATYIRDGTLFVEPKDSFSTEQPIRFHLTVKTLEALRSEGSGTIEASALATPDLELVITGSGRANLRALSCDSLSVKLLGAADLALSGKCVSQEVVVRGSGSYRARDLEARQTRIEARGAGKAEVVAKEKLSVRIAGSAGVTYYGNPRIEQEITGAGTLQRG